MTAECEDCRSELELGTVDDHHPWCRIANRERERLAWEEFESTTHYATGSSPLGVLIYCTPLVGAKVAWVDRSQRGLITCSKCRAFAVPL